MDSFITDPYMMEAHPDDEFDSQEEFIDEMGKKGPKDEPKKKKKKKKANAPDLEGIITKSRNRADI